MISVSSEIKEHNFHMHILTFYEWVLTRAGFFSLHTWLKVHLLHTRPLWNSFSKLSFFFPPFQITIKQFSAEPISLLWYALPIKILIFSHFLHCESFGMEGRQGGNGRKNTLDWPSVMHCICMEGEKKISHTRSTWTTKHSDKRDACMTWKGDMQWSA